MNLPPLKNRLQSAIKYIRKGKILADVGTDHAYLPINSILLGISSSAVASDIVDGPIERARLHIASYGLSEKIKAIKTDGLRDIDLHTPDDITIFGMGGELIVKIIDEAEWVKNPNIRLILQPMTNAHILRAYLVENGFSIIDETLSKDDGRIYQTICAEFCGQTERMSNTELLLGKCNIEGGSPLLFELIENTRKKFNVRLCGKNTSGEDVSYEKEILSELEKLQANFKETK